MENRRRAIIAVLLIISVVNFSRLTKNENIRLVEFVSIWVIGALSAILINEFVTLFKAKRK